MRRDRVPRGFTQPDLRHAARCLQPTANTVGVAAGVPVIPKGPGFARAFESGSPTRAVFVLARGGVIISARTGPEGSAPAALRGKSIVGHIMPRAGLCLRCSESR